MLATNRGLYFEGATIHILGVLSEDGHVEEIFVTERMEERGTQVGRGQNNKRHADIIFCGRETRKFDKLTYFIHNFYSFIYM